MYFVPSYQLIELAILILHFSQKLQERRAMLEKGTYASQEEKEEWEKVARIDFMSGEESDLGEGEEVIVTKLLPWLSTDVSQFFQKLDEAAKVQKTPQPRRQMKPRICGSPSTLQKPSLEGIPTWVFKN